MRYKHVVIESIETHLPKHYITSQELEKKLAPCYERMKWSEGRLQMMTGIERRGFWSSGTLPSELATQAALSLLEKSHVKRSDIDLVVHASVCRDYLEPATASSVHFNLNLRPECSFFDLSNACLGMLNAIDICAQMIEKGSLRKALIVTGENSGPLIEKTIEKLNHDQSLTKKQAKKYFANLTLGSAATALCLSHRYLAPEGVQVIGQSQLSDSSGSQLCQGGGTPDSLMMETDASTMMELGLNLAQKTWRNFSTEFRWQNENIDWFINHQVGGQHQTKIKEALGFNHNKEQLTYPEFGNTGSSAIGLTLWKMLQERNSVQGERICLMGIGSGLQAMMMGLIC